MDLFPAFLIYISLGLVFFIGPLINVKNQMLKDSGFNDPTVTITMYVMSPIIILFWPVIVIFAILYPKGPENA